MSTFFNKASPFSKDKSPKVVVVGAGIAGLTAAYRLQQKGMDVDVYEARNRVGGRIFTVNVDGDVAELGAQNITDGGEAKNICCLADEFGIELIGKQANLNYSYFDGEKLVPIRQLLCDKQFKPDELRSTLQQLALTSRNMEEILDAIIDKEDPLHQAISVRLAAYEGASIENLSTFYIETLFHILLGGTCSVHQGSGGEENSMNLLSIKEGNASLPEKIAKTLGSRLHLNKPLLKVSKEVDRSFTLTFHGGETVKADVLLLAIPCSVYEDIAFEEQTIPLERLEMIKSVRYGTNAKILVRFPNKPPKRMEFVNDQMITFFDVSHRILNLYHTGKTSLFSDDTILNTYVRNRAMLEMGFGDSCPPFTVPVFAEDRAFADYEGPVGYSWPNDPYAKGSYSYIAPGQETLLTSLSEEQGEMVRTLFAPIDQTMYFAGEHTSILLDVPGTMEAACESGERAARMILKTHQQAV